MTWLTRLFVPDRSHLWYNVVYHDPRVLMRSLCDVEQPPRIDTLRVLLRMPLVTPDGDGYSEEQVEAAYTAFLEWYEGKGKTGQSSPTSVPSTDSPAV